jgi:hypothetical protein
MSTISIKVNLRQLKHDVREMKGQSGMMKCLIIPIDQNNLYQGEKGIYLDLTAFELKEKKADSKDTHLVKQSLPKALYDSMTKDQQQALPILGNAIVWAGRQEPEPQTTELQPFTPEGATDDLPF